VLIDQRKTLAPVGITIGRRTGFPAAGQIDRVLRSLTEDKWGQPVKSDSLKFPQPASLLGFNFQQQLGNPPVAFMNVAGLLAQPLGS